MKKELLIIDPQEDFCNPEFGSLYVNGADKDMSRLADMIIRNVLDIDDINITMDSHHDLDVAHPIFWIDQDGNNPNPFTIISYQDVKNRKWIPSIYYLYERMLAYTKELEDNMRLPLCIWPPHCIIGSKGYGVYSHLLSATRYWEKSRLGVVNFIPKGSNVFTENYSAVRAEVVDPKDPSTKPNFFFEDLLKRVNKLYVAGEAGSHCVTSTLRDIYEILINKEDFKKVIWIEDAISPVKGFENLQEDGMKELIEKGMQVSKTTKF